MEKLVHILEQALQANAQTCGSLSKTAPRPGHPAPAKQTMTCTECGGIIPYITVPLFGCRVLPACPCREAAFEQAAAERRQQECKDRLARLFANAGLGSRYRHCTLDNFQPRPGASGAYSAARAYGEQIGENIAAGRGLLLFGPLGTGKSHLVAAVVNAAVDRGFAAIMERVPKLLLTLRATYNGGAVTEQQLMRGMTDADLLVLDDAGSEKWTEWTEPTLYTIIDERYTQQKALLITSNLNLAELQQKIGPRAMDRIVDMCAIVETSGPSYRRERAKKRLAKAGAGKWVK